MRGDCLHPDEGLAVHPSAYGPDKTWVSWDGETWRCTACGAVLHLPCPPLRPPVRQPAELDVGVVSLPISTAPPDRSWRSWEV